MVSENWKALQAKLGITSKPKPREDRDSSETSRSKPFTKFIKKKRKRDSEDENGAENGTPAAKNGELKKKSAKTEDEKPKTGLRIQANLTPVLALDAEMVMISTGKSMVESRHPARVSVVNSHSLTVADMFIRIPEGARVTDYLTEHSGIKPGDLDRPEAVSLEDAKKFLMGLLKDRKVVGHALWNDFEVLGIQLPRESLRDTARLKSLKKGKGLRKLRDIAREVCGVTIQSGHGHDSVEDARAAMMIYKAKKREFEEEARRWENRGKKRKKKATSRGHTIEES